MKVDVFTKLMEQHRYNLTSLSEAIGVNRMMLSRAVNHDGDVPVKKAIEIAKLLNTKVEDIF